MISPYERDEWLRRAGYVTRPAMPDMAAVGLVYASAQPRFAGAPDFAVPWTLIWEQSSCKRSCHQPQSSLEDAARGLPPAVQPPRETTQVLSRLNFDALRTQIKRHPSLLPAPHLGAQRPGGGGQPAAIADGTERSAPGELSCGFSKRVKRCPEAFCNGLRHKQ